MNFMLAFVLLLFKRQKGAEVERFLKVQRVFAEERRDEELQLRSFLIDFTGRRAGVGRMQNMGGLNY